MNVFHDFHYVNIAGHWVLVSLLCFQRGFKLIMKVCYVSVAVSHENAPDVLLKRRFHLKFDFSIASAYKVAFFCISEK